MKNHIYKSAITNCVLLLGLCGCEKPPDAVTEKPSKVALSLAELAGEAYQPVRVNFIPLTEITPAKDANESSKIIAYVTLLDAAGAAIKHPGRFRFELYEYLSDILGQKGKRIAIWQEQDLTSFAENSSVWQDYLRAYQFELAFEPAINTPYILVVTYTSPAGKRLTSEIKI